MRKVATEPVAPPKVELDNEINVLGKTLKFKKPRNERGELINDTIEKLNNYKAHPENKAYKKNAEEKTT